MRSLVLNGPRNLSVEERPARPLAQDEARVEVVAAGICASDVHGYAGHNARRPAGVVMGHEAAGRVAELGGAVDGPAVGTPVAVNPVVGCGRCEFCAAGLQNLCGDRRLCGCSLDLPGAFAESVVVPATNLVPVPESARLDVVALAEPFAVGTHAVELVGAADTALVVGGGPIGIGAALAARRAGIEQVAVSEPIEARRSLLGELGIDAVHPGAIEPRSFAVVFECVGGSKALAAALDAARTRGTVVLAGLAEPVVELAAEHLVVRECRVLGTSCYTREAFADTVAWLASGALGVSPVIQARVPLEELPDAFEAQLDPSRRTVKTVAAP